MSSSLEFQMFENTHILSRTTLIKVYCRIQGKYVYLCQECHGKKVTFKSDNYTDMQTHYILRHPLLEVPEKTALNK